MSDPYRSPKTHFFRNFILFLLTSVNFLLAGCFSVFCLLECADPVNDPFSRGDLKLLLQVFSLLVLVQSVTLICLHAFREKPERVKRASVVLSALSTLFPHGTLILSIMYTVFCILDGFNPNMGFVNGSMSKTLLLVFAFLCLIGNGCMLFAWLRARRRQGMRQL